MRKSSLGLILGIFTHLILLLARFTKPLNKEDKRVMKLEGRIMFPSADVSSPLVEHDWGTCIYNARPDINLDSRSALFTLRPQTQDRLASVYAISSMTNDFRYSQKKFKSVLKRHSEIDLK